jgi:hypothetical protein
LTAEPLEPESAFWDTSKGAMAILMYDDARASERPRETILEFLDSAYRAGAKCAGWDAKKFELAPLETK